MMRTHGLVRAIPVLGFLGSCCYGQTPTLVQHISSGRDNTSGYSNPTYKFFLPNPTLAGNCLILRFDHDSSLTVSSVQTDKGNIFSSGPTINTSGHVIQSYYVSPSTGSQIISVITSGTVGSNTDEAGGDLSEFYNTTCTVDTSGSAAGRSVTLNPTTPNDLIWQSADDTSSIMPVITSMTVGSGYTMLHGNVAQGTFGQYKTGAATGAQTVSFQTSDSDVWQSVAIAFESGTAGTAPPSAGIRIVNMYGEIFGDSTHTMYVPCSGNLLVGLWGAPPVPISAISSSPSATWSTGASALNSSGAYAQIFYGQGMTCNSALTITPAYDNPVSGGGLSFLVMLDIAGASASAHDVDSISQGDQTDPAQTLSPNTITPSTANGLVVAATSWFYCTVEEAAPGIYAGIATNSGNSSNCDSGGNTSPSSLNEDNGMALYYNPNTNPITITYTETGTVGPWAAVASAFKAATVATVSAPSAPSNLTVVIQ
jgi:hypothetical protein